MERIFGSAALYRAQFLRKSKTGELRQRGLRSLILATALFLMGVSLELHMTFVIPIR